MDIERMRQAARQAHREQHAAICYKSYEGQIEAGFLRKETAISDWSNKELYNRRIPSTLKELILIEKVSDVRELAAELLASYRCAGFDDLCDALALDLALKIAPRASPGSPTP